MQDAQTRARLRESALRHSAPAGWYAGLQFSFLPPALSHFFSFRCKVFRSALLGRTSGAP